MTIDVSSILKEYGGRIAVDGAVEIPDTEICGSRYSFTRSMTVNGSISNNGKTLFLDAVCEGVFMTRCARCTKDIEKTLRFEIKEALVQGEKKTDEFEDIIVFEKNDVDVGEIVYNDFILNAPVKILCRDDCRGLCPKCGADLNEGDCGCEGKEIDPRWAALAEMIDKDKI